MIIMLWLGLVLMGMLAMSFMVWPLLTSARRQFHRQTVIAMSLWAWFMLAVALTIYSLVGAYPQLRQQRLLATPWVKQLREASTDELIQRMRKQLREHPEQAQGWYLLGKLYRAQLQWTDAASAFERAQSLRSDHIETQYYYAEVLFYLHDKHLNSRARQLLDSVLKQAPNMSMAINLLAMDAFERHQYTRAIAYWQKILPLYAEDSEDAQAILSVIAKARVLSKQKASDQSR